MKNITKFILAMLFTLLNADLSHSAEFKEISEYRTIVIEGNIEEGDYEKFVNHILEKGSTYRTVLLASKGGHANEAIRIGRLIRALNYETETAKAFPQQNVCHPTIKQGNCICLSSCPLIYLGGVHRYGDALGVHRIYLNHDTLKNLTLN